jgi:hypothetical protein
MYMSPFTPNDADGVDVPVLIVAKDSVPVD